MDGDQYLVVIPHHLWVAGCPFCEYLKMLPATNWKSGMEHKFMFRWVVWTKAKRHLLVTQEKTRSRCFALDQLFHKEICNCFSLYCYPNYSDTGICILWYVSERWKDSIIHLCSYRAKPSGLEGQKHSQSFIFPIDLYFNCSGSLFPQRQSMVVTSVKGNSKWSTKRT